MNNSSEGMRIIKLTACYKDLKEAILNSREAEGLQIYGSEVLNRKAIIHKQLQVREYFISEAGEVLYVTNSPVGYSQILHKFEWISTVQNRGASICVILYENMTLHVSPNKYDKEKLRKKPLMWTSEKIKSE